MNKKYTFHINGMHCKACVFLTESELKDVKEIQSAKSDLGTHTVEIIGDFGDKSEEDIASVLSEVLKPHGYTLSTEKKTHKIDPKETIRDFKFAIPITIAFVILFVVLQKLGLVNLIGAGKVNYGTAFVIGIVASLSTCMAVVGGLLLSISATFAHEKDSRKNKYKPIFLFHSGRLVSFFILGGIIGAIGSAFTLSTSMSFLLGIIIAVVMFILGINLLDTFHFAKKWQIGMPKIFGSHTREISKFNHEFTPLLVGIATFFLPCGFTQSMQIYTLSTGNFLTGGLTMLFFALGTLPVLALISFSSFSIQNNKWKGVFFKSAGLIVIMFALFNFINSLVIIGAINPVFNF